MEKEKLEMLKSYLSSNVVPIFMQEIPISVFGNAAVVIPADISLTSLNGDYKGIDFVEPSWYKKIELQKNNEISILIIDNLSSVSKNDQNKFLELLKYRKVGEFYLPKNCVIIITSDLGISAISEEILSLVAII